MTARTWTDAVKEAIAGATKCMNNQPNGISVTAIIEPRLTLADLLREQQCGLTNTRLGCEHGACTVLLGR